MTGDGSDEYIVVRIEGVPERAGAGGLQSLGGGTLDFDAAPGPAKLEVSRTAMTPAQAAEEARDPRNAVAQPFPVMEIAPYTTEGAADAGGAASAAGPSWGIAAVGAEAAPADAGRGVVVAVLDTGLKDHPCFAGVAVERASFVPDSVETDTRGHGTHCASTIFGRDLGGTRVGIARGVERALIGKVFDDGGRSSTRAVVEALQWAHTRGANIVSMSLGFDFVALREGLARNGLEGQAATSRALKMYRDALRQFDALTNFLRLESDSDPGMLLVAAAGNESRRTAERPYEIDVSMPAASENVISVAALMRQGGALATAPYSNTGATLAAPGSGILGASLGGGLVVKDGTSMACPHVAGVAALWWARFKEEEGYVSAKAVAQTMLARTRRLADIPLPQRGRGLVQAPDYPGA